MSSRFFVDSVPPSQRAGLLAPLAGLVAAVAMFVGTLSLVAESHEAHRAASAPVPAVPGVALAEAERTPHR
jgi:hypothetical protein